MATCRLSASADWVKYNRSDPARGRSATESGQDLTCGEDDELRNDPERAHNVPRQPGRQTHLRRQPGQQQRSRVRPESAPKQEPHPVPRPVTDRRQMPENRCGTASLTQDVLRILTVPEPSDQIGHGPNIRPAHLVAYQTGRPEKKLFPQRTSPGEIGQIAQDPRRRIRVERPEMRPETVSNARSGKNVPRGQSGISSSRLLCSKNLKTASPPSSVRRPWSRK